MRHIITVIISYIRCILHPEMQKICIFLHFLGFQIIVLHIINGKLGQSIDYLEDLWYNML